MTLNPLLMREYMADLTLSILDSIRQRGLSVEEAADVAGIDVEQMRTLVEERKAVDLTHNDLEEIHDASDAIPRYGRKP